jgi:hypothetical protein
MSSLTYLERDDRLARLEQIPRDLAAARKRLKPTDPLFLRLEKRLEAEKERILKELSQQ